MDRFWSGRTGSSFEEHLRTDTSSSVDDLVEAWHRTVGYGVNLVVNFVPRPKGDLSPREVERFARAAKILRSSYATNLALGAHASAGSAAEGHGPEMAIDGSHATWWEALGGAGSAWIEVKLGRPVRLDRIVLGEALQRGQNVESFRVLRQEGSGWWPLAEGLTIGHKRISRFPPVTATGIRVEMSSRPPVTLRDLGLYLGAGGEA
jgi:alpha-L-fucosidase